MRLPADVAAIQVQTVPVGVDPGDGLAVKLTQEDMGQSFQYRRRRPASRSEIRISSRPVLQADETVGVGETTELHAHFRLSGARLQLTKHARVDFLGRFKNSELCRPCRSSIPMLHRPMPPSSSRGSPANSRRGSDRASAPPPFGRRARSAHRSDARDAVHDRAPPDRLLIGEGGGPGRRVNRELNVPAFQQIHRVGPAFIHLENSPANQPGIAQRRRRAARRRQREAEFGEPPGHRHGFRLVVVVDADEDRALLRAADFPPKSAPSGTLRRS